MQIPIDIEVIVEIVPHEGLVDKFLIHQLIEESSHLIAIHRSVKIRSNCREVDSLAQIIVTTVLQTLQKHGDPFLRSRFPILIDQSPEIVRKGVFLTEVKI